MGVVYKAEDTRLDRPVALKFLPAQLLGAEEVKKRFKREAKAAAALDHSNVCTVYEIDEAESKTFISMALEGKSLDKKIEQGPLKLDEALDIGQQIAKGLEAAHKKGVVHRDIKPQNIMVGEDGHVTIMDFGLAQLTQASLLTRPDQTMGTTFYMSPEQTEGSGTDHRTDIWSLGVVLYEMITGQRPFKGDYDKAVMYSILNEEPEPMTALRTGVPMELEILIGRTLSKDSAERPQSSSDVIAELKSLGRKLDSGRSATLTGGTLEPKPTPSFSEASDLATLTRRYRYLQALFAAVALAFFALALSQFSVSEPRPAVRKYAFEPVSLYSVGVITRRAAISPDGRHIVYLSGEQPARLWIRDLDEEVPRSLDGTEGAESRPFWSPDSRFIAFSDGERLKKVPVEGGPATDICDLIDSIYSGGTWSPDGDEIVYSTGDRDLYIVSSNGSEPKLLSEPLLTEKGDAHHAPHFLPAQSRAILYDVGSRVDRDIAVEDLETGERRILVKGSSAYYSPSGHILFNRSPGRSALWALPFSLDTLEPTAEAFPLGEGIGEASVSSDGTLVYLDSILGSEQHLVWRDRSGAALGKIGSPQPVILFPELSPDGSLIAVEASEGAAADIWIHEIDRSIKRRVTFGPGPERFPLWSPVGREIVFTSYRDSRELDLSTLTVGAARAPRVIWSSPSTAEVAPMDWSSDGQLLLYRFSNDLWVLKRNEDGEYSPEPFLQSPFREINAQFSPDGSYVAYCSDQSGREEVYVAKFPSGDDRSQVSEHGGCSPVWRPDGRELFFVAGQTLMAASVTESGAISIGTPDDLFAERTISSTGTQPAFDVTEDGERFVLVETFRPNDDAPQVVHIVENWFEEFRERERPND